MEDAEYTECVEALAGPLFVPSAMDWGNSVAPGGNRLGDYNFVWDTPETPEEIEERRRRFMWSP